MRSSRPTLSGCANDDTPPARRDDADHFGGSRAQPRHECRPVGRQIPIERVGHVLRVTALDERARDHRTSDRLALPFCLTHQRGAIEHDAERREPIEHVLDAPAAIRALGHAGTAASSGCASSMKYPSM